MSISSTQYTCLIIDDYNEAIENLKDLLASFNDIEIKGIANNVEEGIQLIMKEKPHLLFLDVEMPGKSGFDLINELLQAHIQCPKIIFTTAFGHYAIDALRNNAIDYLLKPVNAYDLSMAIQRFRNTFSIPKNNSKLESVSRIFSKSKRVLLPTITGLKQIALSNVLFFQKINNTTEQVKVYYTTTQYDTIPGNKSLKEIIDLLPKEDFYQIDRCTVINLDYLTDIETKSRKCILKKCNEEITLTISRGRLKEFKDKCIS
nr:response regulator transcription factor [uncultured Carboxylicivirga sp.]